MSRRIEDIAEREFQRILFLKPSSLGDIIHALPVLHGLRRRFPSATIDWLCASPFVPLLDGHPDLSEVIRFDRRRFGTMTKSPRAAVEFARFVRGLRVRQYDLTIDLQGLFRTGFLSRACGARVRIGLREAREGAGMFYTHLIPTRECDEHAVDRNFRVSAILGFASQPVEFPIHLSEASRTAAGELLRGAGVSPDERFVAVAPGARWDTKVWPAERFSETIDALQGRNASLRCVLLGSPDETALCERIFAGCRIPPANLSGRSDVCVLAALIERSTVVLCHDSAVAHLAAALNKPLVCITGPTNPRRTGPYGRLADVSRLDLECSPCYLRKLTQCPHSHRCMRDLDAARIIAAVENRLT